MEEYLKKGTWKSKLTPEFHKSYFNFLRDFLEKERSLFTIYPEPKDIFNALNLTTFEDTKVIIIGQDPYHGANQAHGLSFSVKYGVKTPPSLQNIFKELHSDLGLPIPQHGNLSSWANQGVLLLNATLTVRASEPGSHQKKGWEEFTGHIIQLISNEKKHCVFLLWGNFAKTKKNLIDLDKHLVLEAAHPSPLARGAFFGSKHFSKTNDYLVNHNLDPIDCKVPSSNLFE
jgi:uracil-DNA glycosylase